MASSDSWQRTSPAAPMFVEVAARGAKMPLWGPISTDTGATGTARCNESEMSIHGPGGLWEGLFHWGAPNAVWTGGDSGCYTGFA